MTLRHADPLMARGYAAVPTQVVTQTGLSVGARLLYTLVLSYLGARGKAWPGQERLAYELGVSDRTVRTWIGELVTAGMVTVERPGLGQTNRYFLTGLCDLPTPDEYVPSDQDRKPASGLDGNQASATDRNRASGEPRPAEPRPAEPRDDDAGARWREVEQQLAKVPQWASALMRGADLACTTVIDANPDVPWPQIAAAAVASRQDPDAGIRTNSPRQALDMLLADHRSGRGTGAGERGPRRASGPRRGGSPTQHYVDMATRFAAEEAGAEA